MLTYSQCEILISKKRDNRKKLQNNTWLEKLEDGTFGVRLHDTYVVKIKPDGTYILNTGGWKTAMTKQRINDYSPARIFQERGNWYVGNKETPFFNGIVVRNEDE